MWKTDFKIRQETITLLINNKILRSLCIDNRPYKTLVNFEGLFLIGNIAELCGIKFLIKFSVVAEIRKKDEEKDFLWS